MTNVQNPGSYRPPLPEPCSGCSLAVCPIWSACPAELAASAIRMRRDDLDALEVSWRAEDEAAGRRPFGTRLGAESMEWFLDLRRPDCPDPDANRMKAAALKARVDEATDRYRRRADDEAFRRVLRDTGGAP